MRNTEVARISSSVSREKTKCEAQDTEYAPLATLTPHESGLASRKPGMAVSLREASMSTLPEFVGTIHIYLGPYRGNPIALYLRQEGDSCRISPTIYPWNKFVGVGETVNKAAADFDLKWKEGNLTEDLYSGPHWEGGIKPEKPKPPPKPAASPKPATPESAKADTPGTAPQSPDSAPTPSPSMATAETSPASGIAQSPGPTDPSAENRSG